MQINTPRYPVVHDCGVLQMDNKDNTTATIYVLMASEPVLASFLLVFFPHLCQPSGITSKGFFQARRPPVTQPTVSKNWTKHYSKRLQRVPEVTGQLTDTPTRGLPTHGLDISWTGQLADAANRSICCFNCMSRLCGHNTTNRITSVIYV